MQPDDQGVFFVLIVQGGPGSGEFIYDANGNLRSSNVGQVTTDPVQGITCQQGFATYNGFGAVINLLSTAAGKGAFFQYLDNQSAVQGSLILAVASVASTDPVLGTAYGAGLLGVNPAFGDTSSVVGSSISLSAVPFTRAAFVSVFTGAGAARPGMAVNAPEQTTAEHAQMLLEGDSPDGTVLSTILMGRVSGGAALAGVSKALAEVQGAFALVNAALPAFVSTAWQEASVAGVLTGITGSGGATGAIPLTGGDTTLRAVTQIAATQLSGSMPIPANDPNVNTTYRLKASGFGTQGSTAQALTVQLNTPSSATLDAINVTAASLPLNTTFRWDLEAEYTCLAKGATGTPVHKFRFTLQSTGSAGTPIEDIRRGSNPNAWNTTVGGALRVDAFWGSATGGPTISCERTTFERIGA